MNTKSGDKECRKKENLTSCYIQKIEAYTRAVQARRVNHGEKIMEKESLFEVDLEGFEPHTFRKDSNYGKVKKELCDAIIKEIGQAKIDEARGNITVNPIRLEVLFRLWKGSTKVTNTRSEKDLDNLLKPILDVLQSHRDEKKNEPGLNLIENDKLVYEINARKVIVEEEKNEGIHIAVFAIV